MEYGLDIIDRPPEALFVITCGTQSEKSTFLLDFGFL